MLIITTTAVEYLDSFEKSEVTLIQAGRVYFHTSIQVRNEADEMKGLGMKNLG